MDLNNKQSLDSEELNKLKDFKRRYIKIVNSSSYKWVKLFQEEFIEGSFKQKFKFIIKVIYMIFRYFIIAPLKNTVLKNKIKIERGNKSFNNINVACVFDTFTYNMFKDEFNIYNVTPQNYLKVFKENKIDMFFMEFIWVGYNESWLGFRNKISNKDYAIYKILDYCKANNIPTAIWNKEDPMYFDFSIEISKYFDYVFTLEDSLIEKYKQILGHERVYPLRYGINPNIHNPVNKKPMPEKDLVFAGTWYTNHPERMKDYEKVLYPALDYNFDIYSREDQSKANSDKRFPDEFQSHIKGSLSYSQVIEMYKQYKLLLHVNAVNTYAFSRRALESIASGTPVISAYNKGLDSMFGNDILLSRSPEDTKKYIDKYLFSDFDRDKLMMRSMRKVFNEYTSTHVALRALNNVGIKKEYSLPMVSIILVTNKNGYEERIIRNYKSQDYQNKELILIINSMDIDKSVYNCELGNDDNVKIIQVEEDLTLGHCLNIGVEESKGDILAKFDDDDFYSPHYLTDQCHALIYTSADMVGKTNHFCYIENTDETYLSLFSHITGENNYTDKRVAGGTICWKKEVSEKVKFEYKKQGTDTAFIKEFLKNKFIMYSTNRYGYLRIRTKDIEKHTWKISYEESLKNNIFLFKGFDLSKIFI